MNSQEYIGWAVQEISDKYLQGESDEVIYGIAMSVVASVYDSTEDRSKRDFKESMLNVFQSIDKGELDEFTK